MSRHGQPGQDGGNFTGQWGYAGRLMESSPDGTRIFLDREVEIVTATSYAVQVRDGRTGYIQTQDVDETATGGVAVYGAGRPIEMATA